MSERIGIYPPEQVGEHADVYSDLALARRNIINAMEDLRSAAERALAAGLSVADIDESGFTRLPRRPGVLVVRRMLANLFAVAAGDSPRRA